MYKSVHDYMYWLYGFGRVSLLFYVRMRAIAYSCVMLFAHYASTYAEATHAQIHATTVQVSENVDSGLLRLRPGAAELMRLCHEWNIPLLIVSAGVTDVIEETLRNQGEVLSLISVCFENRMHVLLYSYNNYSYICYY
jgi:phosphoserine phosphatase